MDNLDPRLVEIDVVRFEGHGFSMVDNRLFALQLVKIRSDAGHPVPGKRPGGPGGRTLIVLYKRPHRADDINETQADHCLEICEISMNESLLLRGGDVDHLGVTARTA